MITIAKLHAREILDSRGNPTVEVDCLLSDGSSGRAAVPSGASTGKHEAVELRDGNKRRYGGKGVLKAVRHVNTLLGRALQGMDARDQEAIDEKMILLDGTSNKSRLGANAILGASMAVLKAHAASRRVSLYALVRQLYRPRERGAYTLPVPMMNIVNGGAHAPGGPDFQEFMIMPVGAKSFATALQMGSEVFHALKQVLSGKGLPITVGDEGGFAPPVSANEQAPEMMMEAVKQAGYRPGKDILFAMDAAANEFYTTRDKEVKRSRDKEHGCYNLKRDGVRLSSQEMVVYYERLVKQYPFISIEDPLAEDDWGNWKGVMKAFGNHIQIVGDDLFVTNTRLLQKGITDGVANAILIKLNQIGTVTETVRAVDMARSAGWRAIVSHRSGETEDATIADFVVGLGTGQIKTGSLSRSERVAKYNQLLRIEEELGKKAVYPGVKALRTNN